MPNSLVQTTLPLNRGVVIEVFTDPIERGKNPGAAMVKTTVVLLTTA